jgi:hypothetical protein
MSISATRTAHGSAGYLCRRQLQAQALRHDLALLLKRPNTTSPATRDDLHTTVPYALTTYRTGVLFVGFQRQRRHRIHHRLQSQRQRLPQYVAVASLTGIVGGLRSEQAGDGIGTMRLTRNVTPRALERSLPA